LQGRCSICGGLQRGEKRIKLSAHTTDTALQLDYIYVTGILRRCCPLLSGRHEILGLQRARLAGDFTDRIRQRQDLGEGTHR